MKKTPIEYFTEAFCEWIEIYGAGRDYWVFTPAEWRERGDTVLKDAEAVIAFENSLVTLLNFDPDPAVSDELQELAHDFGYYFALGDHWNLGFYSLDLVGTRETISRSSHRLCHASTPSEMATQASAYPDEKRQHL